MKQASKISLLRRKGRIASKQEEVECIKGGGGNTRISVTSGEDKGFRERIAISVEEREKTTEKPQ